MLVHFYHVTFIFTIMLMSIQCTVSGSTNVLLFVAHWPSYDSE